MTRLQSTKSSTRKFVPWIFLAVVFLLLLPAAVATVWVPSCDSCHGDVAEALNEQAHANKACMDCHNTGGNLLYREIVMYSMVIRLANPSNLGAANMGDATCLNCHESIMSSTTTSNGINIKHSACAESLRCVVCHSTAGHSTPGLQFQYSMDQCLGCHGSQGVADVGECDLCHRGRYQSRIPNNTTAFRITHGSNWEQAHGLGDMSTCQNCHNNPVFCGRCHGPLVPHRSNILTTHSAPALDPDNKCGTCHPQSFCDDCHGIEMPHPDGFLNEHSSITHDLGEDRCYGCHVRVTDCDQCHVAHVHPGGPGLRP